MKTLKSLKSHSGKRFKKVLDATKMSIEDIDKLRKELQRLADLNGIELKENENTFDLESQFVFKPKIKRVSYGTVTFRPSGDYVFIDEKGTVEKSYGSKLKKENLIPNGFKVRHFTYTLAEEN